MADYKPADLHVSVIDLFSILMPGALLAGGVMLWWGEDQPPAPLASLLATAPAQWVAFVVGAYSLGHFAFLVASTLDGFYDRYRKLHWPDEVAYTEATKQRCLYFGQPDMLSPGDGVVARKRSVPVALIRALWPKPISGRLASSSGPLNTFSWAKALLMGSAPASAALVERYEADSKFFRSLIVVLPVIGALLGYRVRWWLFPAGLALACLSFVLFAERRHKSTEWAYRLVIVLMRERVMGPARSPSAPAPAPTPPAASA